MYLLLHWYSCDPVKCNGEWTVNSNDLTIETGIKDFLGPQAWAMQTMVTLIVESLKRSQNTPEGDGSNPSFMTWTKTSTIFW